MRKDKDSTRHVPRIDPVQQRAVELLERIIEQTGLTVTGIARASGISPSTLTRMYPKPTIAYTLSSRTLEKLKDTFPAAVMPGSMSSHQASGGAVSIEETSVTASSLFDVPVFSVERSTVAFGPGKGEQQPWIQALSQAEVWRDLGQHPVTQMRVQHNIGGEKRFFGVYVAGDAMAPRMSAGEIALVDTLRPLAQYSDAFVKFSVNGEHKIILARLIDRNARDVTLEFYNEVDGRLSIPRFNIVEAFPIVAVFTGGM